MRAVVGEPMFSTAMRGSGRHSTSSRSRTFSLTVSLLTPSIAMASAVSGRIEALHVDLQIIRLEADRDLVALNHCELYRFVDAVLAPEQVPMSAKTSFPFDRR